MNCNITKGTDYEWSEQGHGSGKVMGGRLKGQTDTDYFNFLCPQCADGQVMRIIDGIEHVGDTHRKYFLDGNKILKNHKARQRRCMVHLSFKIYCYECKFTDIVKISNLQIAINRNINNDSFGYYESLYAKKIENKATNRILSLTEVPIWEGGATLSDTINGEIVGNSTQDQEINPDIYFIQGEMTQNIKIGVSKNPERRMRSLESSEPLNLLAIIKEGGTVKEKKLHRQFKHLRLHGEWFRPDKELLEFIDNLNQ